MNANEVKACAVAFALIVLTILSLSIWGKIVPGLDLLDIFMVGVLLALLVKRKK